MPFRQRLKPLNEEIEKQEAVLVRVSLDYTKKMANEVIELNPSSDNDLDKIIDFDTRYQKSLKLIHEVPIEEELVKNDMLDDFNENIKNVVTKFYEIEVTTFVRKKIDEIRNEILSLAGSTTVQKFKELSIKLERLRRAVSISLIVEAEEKTIERLQLIDLLHTYTVT